MPYVEKKDATTLRQREWVILTRPYYYDAQTQTNIFYDKVPKCGWSSDLGKTGPNTATALVGVNEGMETGSNMPIDKGGWVMWYKTNSFPKLREKYRKCLDFYPREHTRIIEIIPADIMVTPVS